MKPRRKQESATEQQPGSFTDDGSWNAKAGYENRGDTHRFTAAMIRQRTEGRLTPVGAANAVLAANQAQAFPNHEQWVMVGNYAHSRATLWPLVSTSTSAEEAVKRAGSTSEGHWCGEGWSEGVMRDCPDFQRHRKVECPDDCTNVEEARRRVEEAFS